MGCNKFIQPPSPEWVAARKAEGMDDDAIKERWEKGMTRCQRYQTRKFPALRAANLKAAQERYAAGARDPRTVTIVRQGGYKMHETREEAAAAEKACHLEAALRRSAEWLAFREANAKGCVVDGCPLAPGIHQLPVGIFIHDHRDGEDKVGAVSSLREEGRREREVAKTDCKCLWHFFLARRERRGNQAITAQPGTEYRSLVESKVATGCQHPVHASMPYAPLVPLAGGGLSTAGFFEVSHVKPSGNPYKIASRVGYCIRELESGAARVDCKFCHRLHTICEAAKMHDTAGSQVQFQQLLRTAPAFVQHFETTTDGFDWAGEFARRNTNKSTAARKKKRPREIADDDLFKTKGGAYTRDEERRLGMCL